MVQIILPNETFCQEEEEDKEDKVEVVRSVLRTCYRNFVATQVKKYFQQIKDNYRHLEAKLVF